MRICMLVYYYWPRKAGGAESQCRKLVQQLRSRGHQITVATTRYSLDVPVEENTQWEQIIRLSIFELLVHKISSLLQRSVKTNASDPIENIPGEGENGNRVFPGTVKKVIGDLAANMLRYLNIFVFSVHLLLFFLKNRTSFDVIHVHTADWIAGIATIIGKLWGIPVVCKGADTPVFPDLTWVPFSRLLNTWRKKPYFIALTDAMREDLITNNVSEQMIEVIPNGVKIPLCVADPGKTSTFLFLGNFSQTAAHKGFDVLLHAWARVIEKGGRAQLILAGGGDSSEWKALAKELDIENTVSFPGFCSDTEKLFMESCCLILPSRKEGLSNALLEAQSYGLPAVVSDIPGNREVVIDGKTGIITPIGDSIGVSDAILKFCGNSRLRREYGHAARERMISAFSIDSITTRVELLYRRIAS